MLDVGDILTEVLQLELNRFDFGETLLEVELGDDVEAVGFDLR